MINVLITAIGEFIGQGLLKSLRMSSYRLNIIGTDINPEMAGIFMCDKGYIVPPAQNKTQYLRRIIDICKKEKIDIIFSCHEKEQRVFASNMAVLSKSIKAYVVVSPIEVITLCQDKLRTYKFLSQKDIRVPETAATKKGAEELIKKYGFPIALKSRKGSGSRYLHVVKNKKEFTKFWHGIPGPIAQEYIISVPEEEYTVGIFLDKQARALGAITMLRQLRYGVTSYAIVDDYPDVTKLAITVAESVGAVGPCNVQLRRDSNGSLCVIEINSRISSTTASRAMLGFNEGRASIDYFLKNKKPDLRFKKAVCIKTWGELVVPVESSKKLKETGKVINKAYEKLHRF